MGIVPENLKKNNSPWLKGESFDGKGLVLAVVGFEIVKASNEEYGADEKNFLVKDSKLKVGETVKYTFKTLAEEGDADSFEEEKVFESTSPGFFIAFTKVDPDVGDVLNIRREGKAAKTRYFIDKV